MLHLTSWNKSELRTDCVYSTRWNVSNYWQQKLKGDWLSFIPGMEVLTQADDPTFKSDGSCLKNFLIHSKYCAEVLKEYIFEEVRNSFYSQHPSRMNCLFAFPDNSDIDQMRVKFTISNELRPTLIRITPVTGQSSFIKADANLLNCDFLLHDGIADMAQKYWSGVHQEDSLIEILLSGVFTISEIIE